MKNMFETASAAELRDRLARRRAGNAPPRGTRRAAQAVAHCAFGLETAMGDHRPPRVLIGRLLGPVVKRLALRDDAPMRRNSPTVPSLAVADARELETQRRRLLETI